MTALTSFPSSKIVFSSGVRRVCPVNLQLISRIFCNPLPPSPQVNCAQTLHLPLERMGEEDETFDRNTNISGCDKEFVNGFVEKGVDRQLQGDKGKGDPSLLMQVELQDGDTQFKVMETDVQFDTP
jgi:hypothetical protein